MARLILTLNNKTIGSYMVAQGEQLTIGRHSTNNICIDNVAVSAHHASIRIEDHKLILTDLGSRNTTLVNGSQVTACNLAHQDWITFGKHILIVDLYESLSLETPEKNKTRATSPASEDALETMFVDRKEFESGYISIDYLSSLKAGQQDYELTHRRVKIGSKDADIKIPGLWSFLAGKLSATISRINGAYIIEHVGGLLKPKINGILVKRPTRLNHKDIIKIGPLEMQLRSIRRPSK